MSDPSPSETLRAAAARLRACSPFVLIAGKRVAVEPLAAWLEQDAQAHDRDVDLFERTSRRRGSPAGGGMADPVTKDYLHKRYAESLAFAHSILEQP